MNDLISVIIPVYNAEKYLKECIDSVLSQTYKNYEIIIINDGSKDNSGFICDQYAAKYSFIKVFHKENGGASSARNIGIQEAKGDYIFFLDSDDWLDDNALKKMHDTAKNEDSDLVFCEATIVDEHKVNLIKGNYEYKGLYETGVPYDIMLKMMDKKEFHVAIWMLLIKKSVFDENNLRFKEGIIYEDMIISYQLYCLATRAAHVKDKLYYRRYRDNSVMTSERSEKNFKSALTVYYEVADFFEKLPTEKKSTAHIVRCSFNALNIYRLMTKSVKKKYRASFVAVKKDILKNNAYSSTALKLDCYSHILWIIYKAFSKLSRKG